MRVLKMYVLSRLEILKVRTTLGTLCSLLHNWVVLSAMPSFLLSFQFFQLHYSYQPWISNRFYRHYCTIYCTNESILYYSVSMDIMTDFPPFFEFVQNTHFRFQHYWAIISFYFFLLLLQSEKEYESQETTKTALSKEGARWSSTPKWCSPKCPCPSPPRWSWC